MSRMLLGLANYFHDVDDALPAKEVAVKHAYRCLVALGVVAEPLMSETFQQCICAVAKEMDGLIWDGFGLSTPSGKLLLNAAGESDTSETL